MPRLALPAREDMNDEQRRIHDRRCRVTGDYQHFDMVCFHQPMKTGGGIIQNNFLCFFAIGHMDRIPQIDKAFIGQLTDQAIQNPNGFTGVDGLFRFTPNGLVQRGLAVLEVEPQGAIVISPAPQSFQDLGY